MTWPDEDDQDAEVEQRAADAQQPRLVELRRPGGPAELVVAPAPDVPPTRMAIDDVRAARPRAAPRRSSAGPGGQRDVGPRSLRVTRRRRSRSRRGRRSPAADRCGRGPGRRPRPAARGRAAGCRRPRTAPAYGVPSSTRASRSSSRPARCSRSSGQPDVGRATRRSPARRAGSRAARRRDQLAAAAAVDRLETGQRQAAPPGLAVGPPGQVEAAAPAVVEELHVVLLAGRARRLVQGRDAGDRAQQALPGRTVAHGAGRVTHRGVGRDGSARRGSAAAARPPGARPPARRPSPGGPLGAGLLRRRPSAGTARGCRLPSQLSRLTAAPRRLRVRDAVAGLARLQHVEGLDGDRRRPAGRLAERARCHHARAAVVVEASRRASSSVVAALGVGASG